ncbi:MAG: hypothetical protein AB7S66_10210 [Sphaerochaeta sp.]|uniref:hypothetical protein n=1 Tax=Sphaerochaeta sp. TaxID=1972642 RepID=UPI003D134CE3
MKECISLLIIAMFCVVTLSANETLSFPDAYEAQLPSDASIGQIVRGEEGSAEAITRQALMASYGPAWLEQYVSAVLRRAFTNTYDQQLLSLLPAKQVQVGRAVVRSDLYEVPFCVHEPDYRWGTMVWNRGEDERWVLLAIKIEPSL